MAAVVADNGSGTCNTEFAGDDAPRVQPTVIFRVFANAWICAQRATDRDLESVFVKRKVNAWICASQTTDRDLETKK